MADQPKPLKDRIDAAAHRLLDLMDKEEDGKTLGGLFGQVVAWYKVQHDPDDEGEGSRLTEMTGNVETVSNSGKRGRGTGASAVAADQFRRRAGVQSKTVARDGAAIRALIKGGLPTIGSSDDGDSEDIERQGIRSNGDGWRVRADGDGTSAGNYDESAGRGDV